MLLFSVVAQYQVAIAFPDLVCTFISLIQFFQCRRKEFHIFLLTNTNTKTTAEFAYVWISLNQYPLLCFHPINYGLSIRSGLYKDKVKYGEIEGTSKIVTVVTI